MFALTCLRPPPAAVPTSRDASSAEVFMHTFRRFDEEWSRAGAGRNLSDLFRPPVELMFMGNFTEVCTCLHNCVVYWTRRSWRTRIECR